ncbi:hypothetical protein [Halalkalibacter okhensis]|nr:hypothetical protein [Halalkalibacter okhensis]
MYKALSFNKHDHDFVEIVYPKIEAIEDTFLYMYNIMVLDELVVEVDLK